MSDTIEINKKLASKIGVTNAIVMSEILKKSNSPFELNKIALNDIGMISYTNSIDLAIRIEFLSLRTIQRSISDLVGAGLITRNNSNDGFIINKYELSVILDDNMSC